MTIDRARCAVLDGFRSSGGHADVWRLFADAPSLAAVVDGLTEPWRGCAVTRVVGIESRGFLLGGAVSVALGVGFVGIRKGEGLLPGRTVSAHADHDYRGVEHLLRMQAVLEPTDHVLLVDDWAERGSQALAARELVQACRATFAGVSLVVDQLGVDARSRLGRVTALVTAAHLGDPDGDEP